MPQPPVYNAKTLPLGNPNIAAANYGVTNANVGDWWGKIWANRANKAGGSKQIFDKVSSWASPESLAARGQNPNSLQWRLLNDAIRTGKVDPRLRPDLLRTGAGVGLSETARAQQHKKGFFDSAFGKILGGALTVGAGFLPGGQFLAPMVGAGLGGVQGGLKGALLGGLSGYGAGQLAGRLGNAATATGGWGSALSHPGNFIDNVFRGGGLTSLPGAAGSAGSLVGSGGNSMGVLGDFLSGARNILGAGDYGGGNIFGDLVRGGLSYFGSQNAANIQSDAAERAFQNSRFTPYNINTPGGSATFNGNNITTQLSPEMQAIAGQQRGLVNSNLAAYNKFNPSNYSQNMYRTLSNLRAPQQTAENNNLLSNTYNLGRWGSTVGAQDIYSANMAQNLQDQALRMQSQQAGAQESDRLFNNYMKSAASYNTLLNSPNDFARLGLMGGQAQSGANANAMQYPWLAAQNSSDASAAFWSTIGNSAGNMISNAGNSINNGIGFRNNYRSQYNPNTGYFVDYPVG